jgi:predicted TIM-barrel fold metal-dependent hydrolase
MRGIGGTSVAARNRLDVLYHNSKPGETAFCYAASGTERPMPFIDAHVHVYTADTTRYPLAAPWTPADMVPASFTAEELFQHAKPAGIDRVNLIQIRFYGFDNSYMLDTIDRYPDVFVGTAVIDPLAEHPGRLMTALAKRRVRAFRIRPELSKQPVERWLRPEGYARMFAAGAKNRQAMSCLIEPNCLPELDRMCMAFPDTPVIIDHLCRIGLDGVIRNEDVAALCKVAKHENVMVKVGGFYALGQKRPPYDDLVPVIQAVIQAFGPDRCMWESDSPYQMQGEHTYRASIDRLDFLDAAAREWLLCKTAERFFFD